MTHLVARRAGVTTGATTLAAAACVAYGVFVERRWYRLRHETIPALAPGAEPLSILHVSDLHLVAGDAAKRDFLALLAGRPVDLVVLTGDILGEPASLGEALTALGRFSPRLGAVAVLGSNDYYAPIFKNYLAYFRRERQTRTPRGRNPWRELVAALEGMDWRVLCNVRDRVGDVEVAGMDDPHIHRERLGTAAPPDGTPARLRLGVVHSPYTRVLDAFAANGYGLILAGHTHGGQVRLPGYGALVTNCDLPRTRVRGVSRWGDAWLHVSAGLGTSKFAPFRFACRPEACLLELVPAG